MRLLGRDRIRRIRNCEPERLDAVELRAVCEMAELHRQHVRRCEKRESQVERTSKSKNQYLNPDEAYRIWLLVAAEAERDRKAGLKMSRAITTELVYLLMAGAGLRVDEVCNLTFEG